MKREDFTYESRDGINKIHAVRWTPDDLKPIGILQIIHGMAEHVERYEDFANFACSKGFIVTAEDHLGHGATVTDGTYGYFCRKDPATVVVRDVHRLKKITQEQFPGLPYFILGHSMGSFILRNYLFRYGSGIDGAIVMGTGMQPKVLVIGLKVMSSLACVFGKEKKPCRFINKAGFGAYQKRISNPRTSNDWLTKDDKVVDKYNADPLCGFVFTGNGFMTLSELILRLYKKSNLEKMPKSLKVLITSGADDPVGDYGAAPKAVFDSYTALGMTNVSLKLFEGDRHEILNETDKEQVYSFIYEWIAKAL